MKRIIYVSTAELGLDEQDIGEIATKAARKNVPRRITGILAFNGGNFLQILEGPDDALDELYAIIEKDARHSGVVKLSDAPIDRKTYPTWGMMFQAMLPKDAPHHLQIRETIGEMMLAVSSPDMRALISSFMKLGS